MVIDVYSRKSPLKSKIEDAYAVNRDNKVFAVFDGVTPLSVHADPESDNDARRASQLFKAHFEHADCSEDLARELIVANDKLRDWMLASNVDMSQRHLLWSTCAIAAYLGADYMSFAQLGDCMALTMDPEGRVHVWTRNLVDGVGARAIEKRKSERQRGIYMPEAFFKDSYHRHAYCRWMANTPEGYGVANGMQEVKDYIQTGRIPRDEVQYLLLLSDGLFHPDETLEQVMRQVVERGLQAYAEDLEALEQSRGLHHDDKTGILIRI